MAIPDRIPRKLKVRPAWVALGLFALAGSSSAATMQGDLASILSKLQVNLYGYVRADASYDDFQAVSAPQNFAARVAAGGEDDTHFTVTARQTRLGLKIAGPESGGVKTAGRIEVDFYGGGAEDSNFLRIRHAYVNLDWEGQDMSLLAGQTSDVISPLVAPTVNYIVLWLSGDMGFRNPQVRLTKGFKLSKSSRLQLQGALVRSEGGESQGPGYQGRLSYTFPGLGGRATTVGVYGHSSEEIDAGSGSSIDSSSTGLDFAVPLTNTLNFRGEYWMGENLDEFLGGIAGNLGTMEVEADGWWGALSYAPGGNTSYNVGYGVVEGDSSDLAGSGMLSENSTLFANVKYKLNSATTLALELGQHNTDYEGGSDESGLRVQFALIFAF